MASTNTSIIAALSQKYSEEKSKRVRLDGNEQYIELEEHERWKALNNDPWVDHARLNGQAPALNDGDEVKLLVLGAGFGGLLYGIRFVEAGFAPEDVRLVDTAGGFGGTWWWNRYPGLMCDVESYVYLPLLEETGYQPKHKYAYGSELREYANLMAERWGLGDKGVFRTAVESFAWDEEAKRWVVEMEQHRGPAEKSIKMTVRSQFVVLANGVLDHPKIPKGLDQFEGSVFHTARWNYTITGGSPTDPTLSKLEGKRVGIIGTGATAIQVVPQLAKSAGELFVFQRTPSSVSERGQHETTPEEWKKVAYGPGWHRKRMQSLNAWVSGAPGKEENLVNDKWTLMKAYCGAIGGPHDNPITMEEIPGHIGRLLQVDVEHSEGVRKRVDAIVKDATTAEALKAWYPSWCKRPTFHDDYLPAFNQPNVHLVDTDGKGIAGSTKNGVLVGEKEYALDVLVLSTGYRPPGAHDIEPSSRSNMTVIGRNGTTLADKWHTHGAHTLHGTLTNNFPNLFLSGPSQVGQSANFAYVQDVLSTHAAYIAAEAIKRAGTSGAGTATAEASVEAEGAWTGGIMQRAAWFASMAICTPGYTTNEGELERRKPEDMMKGAMGAPYALGINSFEKVLEAWRADGKLEGVIVSRT
jgi:cation diffusion facilitator CzcD-associated flavoprotein CzcO